MGFIAGQRVRISNPSGRYDQELATVLKVLPKNVDVELGASGSGRRLRVHPSFLTADTDARPAPLVVPLDPLPPATGTVVRVVEALAVPDPRLRGLFVVIGVRERRSTGALHAKVARLGGGDGSQYWVLPPAQLDVVPLDELVGQLELEARA